MLTNVFFRLLNFIVLILIVGYAAKRKFLKNIRAKIKQKDAEIINLTLKRKELLHQQENMETTIAQESILIDNLKHNIIRWKKVRDELEQQQKAQKLDIEQALTRKSEFQVEQQFQESVKKKIIPEVIEQSRISLKKQLTKPEQERYVHAILNHV